MHQQTGTAPHAQQTDLTNRPHLTCSTNREKNNTGNTRGRHPSANRKRQPQQTSVMVKLDYTTRFVRVIPTLSPNQSSHNSIGHGGRYNISSTSQQNRFVSHLSQSISNDLHVNIATPPGFLLTLRFSSLVHHLSVLIRRKKNNTQHIYIKHSRTYNIHTKIHIYKHTHVPIYMLS